MLFRKVMTEVNDDGDEREFVSIAEQAEEPYSDDKYRVRYETVGAENVTVLELVQAIGDELESENHHSESSIPDMIAEHVTKIAGSHVAKMVLFSMIEDKGLSLGL